MNMFPLTVDMRIDIFSEPKNVHLQGGICKSGSALEVQILGHVSIRFDIRKMDYMYE